MMSGGRRRMAIALACTLASAGALRAEPAPDRRVVGTIRTTGQVEGAVEPGRWRPLIGGAIVERMMIRTTGTDAAAVLELPNGDVIALASDTTCAVMPGTPRRLRLDDGRIAYR